MLVKYRDTCHTARRLPKDSVAAWGAVCLSLLRFHGVSDLYT